MNSYLTLESFGLTPVAIARHVTRTTPATRPYQRKMQRPVTLLERLGLTREAILRHVVAIAPPVQAKDLDATKIYRAKQTAKRKANLAAGLTSHGTVRIRKFNPELKGLDKNEYARRHYALYGKPGR